MHGGMKVYVGDPAAARVYVEADRGRADDYYLAEGSGFARHFTATDGRVAELVPLTGDTYETWVANRDPDTGQPRGSCATTSTRCGSWRWWSTARRPGRRPPRCIRTSPGRTRRRRTGPPGRSSAGCPCTPPPGRLARPAGPGAAGGAAGGNGAALHLPSEGSALASAPADPGAGARRRKMARAAHPRGPRLPRGDQRHRARGDGM